jgi:hypothetical protein
MKRTTQWSLRQFFYFMLAIALTVTACKKGDTGPQGEKGDKGDTGANGASGSKGDKGETGTANVQYSQWFDVTFSYDAAQQVYYKAITAPAITDEVLSTGEVKVYFNFGSPANKLIFSIPGIYPIYPLLSVGEIELQAPDDFGTFTDTQNNKRFQYRYVIIPGGTGVRKNTSIDWNNYAEVQKHLGLKD